MKETEKTRPENGWIPIPRRIAIIAAIAILCVIADLTGELVEYFQGDRLPVIRIIIRCLVIAGWGISEWYIVERLWSTRKMKHE